MWSSFVRFNYRKLNYLDSGVPRIHSRVEIYTLPIGYLDVTLNTPSGAYSYTVGTAGSGGTSSSAMAAGGVGAAGIIIIDEFYQ